MKTLLSVIRPDTLVEGRKYLLRTRGHASREVSCVPVVFVGYCPCSAMVCIDDRVSRRCCSRDDIFTCEVNPC